MFNTYIDSLIQFDDTGITQVTLVKDCIGKAARFSIDTRDSDVVFLSLEELKALVAELEAHCQK